MLESSETAAADGKDDSENSTLGLYVVGETSLL